MNAFKIKKDTFQRQNHAIVKTCCARGQGQQTQTRDEKAHLQSQPR